MSNAQLLDAILRQARVLDRVTADLLTASQSERGVLNTASISMDLLAALTAAALVVTDPDSVSVDCPPALWVHADPVRVEQMLANLISNALKYGRPPIRLVGQRLQGEAIVRVIDSGTGVAPDFVPRLFNRYSRANGLRANGIGIGLFVVRSLAQAQGGAAWYKPTEDGRSQFCFTLPIALAEQAQPKYGSPSSHSPEVLVPGKRGIVQLPTGHTRSGTDAA